MSPSQKQPPLNVILVIIYLPSLIHSICSYLTWCVNCLLYCLHLQVVCEFSNLVYPLRAVTLVPRWHVEHRRGLVTIFLSEWVRRFSKSPSSAISLGPDPSPDRKDIYASVVESSTIWIGSACHHMVPCPYVMWLSLYVEALLSSC